MKIRYSVIIPTYNRGRSIYGTLFSLLDQTVPANAYEILVIDDGSTDKTPQAVKEFIKTHRSKTIIYHRIKHGGPAHARNAGIRRAKGSIIFFTDDDCVVPPNWLEVLADGYRRHPKAVGVGGGQMRDPALLRRSTIAKFIQFSENRLFDRERLIVANHSEYFGQGDERGSSKEYSVGNTANMSYQRRLFQKIGGFDETIYFPGSEDWEFKKRVDARGYPLVYRAIFVYHQKPATVRTIFKKHFMAGRGIHYIYDLYPKLERKYLSTREWLGKFRGLLAFGGVPFGVLLIIETMAGWTGYGFASLKRLSRTGKIQKDMSPEANKLFSVLMYPLPAQPSNPYLSESAASLRKHPAVESVVRVSPRYALARQSATYPIVHLQWIQAASVSKFGEGFLAWVRWLSFNLGVIIKLLVVWVAKYTRGTKVVWTIHDAPRLDVHPTMMALLRRLHFAIADGFFIHTEVTKKDIPRRYAQRPTMLIPRPNFIGQYGPPASPEEVRWMRQQLGVTEKETVFLVFGTLRMYKNLEPIIESFQKWSRRHPAAHLLIVGEPFDRITLENVQRMIATAPNITLIPRLVPNRYVRGVIAVGDYIVVGQERGYTSGTMFLSLSYGRPVIIRDWGAAPMYVRHGMNGYLFDWETLPQAFEDAYRAKQRRLRYKSMCDAAVSSMKPLTWSRTANQIVSFYQQLTQSEKVGSINA